MRFTVILFLLICAALHTRSQPRELTKLWESDKVFRVPESVLFSKEHNCLFVSNIDGKPTEKDGTGYIAKVGPDGKIIEEKFVAGLNAPKGMGIYNNMLYVTDIDEVISIDIKTRSIVLRTPVEDSRFLNDVTIDEKGVVYFSDMNTGMIHRLVNGKPELYISGIEGVNGLFMGKENLYAVAKGVLWQIKKNKEKTAVARGMDESSDGLIKLSDGSFMASSWNGIVYGISAAGKIKPLLDTRSLKLNTADIGADTENYILYVPTFFGNTIAAYKYKK